MQNSMVVFAVFDRKQPFWTNLVQKIKIISLSTAEVWYLNYFEYLELDGDVHFFRF